MEHRGSEHASREHRDCKDGCGTCVDNMSGIGMGLPAQNSFFGSSSTLPSGSQSGSSSATSLYSQFLSLASKLPLPPSNRSMGRGGRLDPMNVMVYPSAAMTEERGVPFGLVRVPRMECCGGRCGCAGGACSCGKGCDGACEGHDQNRKEKEKERDEVALAPVVRSCCAGKVKAVAAV